MKDLVSGIRYDASNVISQAIGPSKEFCMGYLNPGVVGGEGCYKRNTDRYSCDPCLQQRET